MTRPGVRANGDREREPTVTGSASCKGGSASRDDQEHESAMTRSVESARSASCKGESVSWVAGSAESAMTRSASCKGGSTSCDDQEHCQATPPELPMRTRDPLSPTSLTSYSQ